MECWGMTNQAHEFLTSPSIIGKCTPHGTGNSPGTGFLYTSITVRNLRALTTRLGVSRSPSGVFAQTN